MFSVISHCNTISLVWLVLWIHASNSIMSSNHLTHMSWTFYIFLYIAYYCSNFWAQKNCYFCFLMN